MSLSKHIEVESPIKKPILGEAIKDLKSLPYPLGATYKADGIRALKINGSMKSRTMKPIRNCKINDILSEVLPEGADGEIVVGEGFSETSSSVMSNIGSGLFKEPFTFYWFDWVQDLKEPYSSRMVRIKDYMTTVSSHPQLTIIPLIPIIVNNQKELEAFEQDALSKNFEGVIVRRLDSPYKCGRSTLKQAYLLKLKRFEDDEGQIIDFEELMHNENDAFKDERGYTKRSSCKEHLTSGNTVVAFVIKTKEGLEFKLGTGFTADQRLTFWKNRKDLLNKFVKYKYFPVGIKDLPRHPVFLGFRDPDDM